MKKRIFIYVFILLFLCGCDVKYNVTLNENLSIEESATVTETEDYFSENLSKDEKIKLIYSPYEEKVLAANYYVIDYRKDEDSGKYLSNSFSNITDFINQSIFYKHYWAELKYVENDNLITIQTTSDFIVTTEYSYNRSYVDNCEITFTLPYKVTASTADSCEISNNNYICKWLISGDTEDKSFSLTFDKQVKVSEIPNNNSNNNNGNNGSIIDADSALFNILIIVGLILLIVGLIVIIALIVNYKEKKDLEKQERGK